MKFNTMLVTTTLIMAIAHGPVGAQELEREFIDPAGVFTQVVTVAVPVQSAVHSNQTS